MRLLIIEPNCRIVNIYAPLFHCFSKAPDVELAVVIIPARFVPQAIRDCGEKGVKLIAGDSSVNRSATTRAVPALCVRPR